MSPILSVPTTPSFGAQFQTPIRIPASSSRITFGSDQRPEAPPPPATEGSSFLEQIREMAATLLEEIKTSLNEFKNQALGKYNIIAHGVKNATSVLLQGFSISKALTQADPNTSLEKRAETLGKLAFLEFQYALFKENPAKVEPSDQLEKDRDRVYQGYASLLEDFPFLLKQPEAEPTARVLDRLNDLSKKRDATNDDLFRKEDLIKLSSLLSDTDCVRLAHTLQNGTKDTLRDLLLELGKSTPAVTS